jgi:hypothetical protein
VNRFLISTTIETLKVLRSIVEEDARIDLDQVRQVRSNVRMLLGAYEGMKAGAEPEAPAKSRLPDSFVRVGNDVINMALVERIRIDPLGQPAGRVQVDFSRDALHYSGEGADLVRALLLVEPAPEPAEAIDNPVFQSAGWKARAEIAEADRQAFMEALEKIRDASQGELESGHLMAWRLKGMATASLAEYRKRLDPETSIARMRAMTDGNAPQPTEAG